MATRPGHFTNHGSDVTRSWVWSQHWLDLLFLHWRVPVAALRSCVPAPLEIETYDGSAWVSLVLFRLRVRPRWLPFLPGVSTLIEVNLRTYVSFRDRPGIWFLSVHADNVWAMRLAKLFTPMPYTQAPLRYRRLEGRFEFRVGPATGSDLALALTFIPDGEGTCAVAGTLDEWLLERYRLFVRGRRSVLMQAEVAHPPWLTQRVAIKLSTNQLRLPSGLDLCHDPESAHFSAGVRARFGAFREIDRSKTAPSSSLSRRAILIPQERPYGHSPRNRPRNEP